MRARETMSFRIKKQLKKQFKQTVTKKGFSTCFILETLIQGWLAASKADSVHPGTSITINQHIDYNVKKSRRTLAFRGNCYTETGYWIYKKPLNKEEINPKNQHHISCRCRDCLL